MNIVLPKVDAHNISLQVPIISTPSKKSTTEPITGLLSRRQRFMSNQLDVSNHLLKGDSTSKNRYRKNTHIEASPIQSRSPIFSWQNKSDKRAIKELTEQEKKEIRSKKFSQKLTFSIVMKIFKNIQEHLENGREVQLRDIGLKETPYHQLLLEEEASKRIVKRQDFIDTLEREKRFTSLVSNRNKDQEFYQKLEYQLSDPDLRKEESDVDLFKHTRAQTMEPEDVSRTKKNLSFKIFKNVDKINKLKVQNHLKRLEFSEGRYKLNQSDSSKHFTDRPFNEIYQGKLKL